MRKFQGEKEAPMSEPSEWTASTIVEYIRRFPQDGDELWVEKSAYDKLKEELAEARAELAIAKSLPLIGAGHYKSELDIHVKESLAFVKQAAEKIDALTAERDSLRTESRLLEELSNTSDLSGRVHLIEKLKKTRDKRESGGSWFCDKCQVAVSPHHNHECPPSPTQESE
jgi:ubiquitin C-terminal hydrolase